VQFVVPQIGCFTETAYPGWVGPFVEFVCWQEGVGTGTVRVGDGTEGGIARDVFRGRVAHAGWYIVAEAGFLGQGAHLVKDFASGDAFILRQISALVRQYG